MAANDDAIKSCGNPLFGQLAREGGNRPKFDRCPPSKIKRILRWLSDEALQIYSYARDGEQMYAKWLHQGSGLRRGVGSTRN